MEPIITGRRIEITDAIRNYVNKRLSPVSRHMDNIVKVHVILQVEKERQTAEAVVHVPGTTITASATSNNKDMYEAIDNMVAKLNRQLIKHKEKE